MNLLQKLYSLYNDVIDTINGYYDMLWSDINIEKINTELSEFQNKLHICYSIKQKMQYYIQHHNLIK